MYSIGIVPAAGLGKRWGYYPKFLLPCGEREWLLDRTVNAMPCDEVVVVYSDQTAPEIVHHVDRCGLGDKVTLRPNDHMEYDFYGSILAGIEESADYYYFGMPDTYWPLDVFPRMEAPGLTLGTFQTDRPERFGMLRNGVVVDKRPGEPGLAWGLIGWDREVRDLWLHAPVETYTQALNLAIQECGLTCVPMDYYYDMATFKHYVEFIKSR